MSGGGDERRRKLLQLASAGVFLTVAVVLVLIVVSANDSGGGDAGDVEHEQEIDLLLDGIPQQGLVLGDPGAKAKLVEFGDMQCPVCKGFSENQVAEVIESQVRSGKARIEFRNFVILGPESEIAGAAVVAAAQQGRGWNYLELFYRNQGAEQSGYVTDEFLTAIAEKAGVADIDRWNGERESKAVTKEVTRTTEQAESLGFEGTPSFAVEGPASHGLEARGFLESAGELEEALEAAVK